MRGSSPIRCAAAFAVLLAMLALGACRAEHPAIVAFAYGRFGEALAGFRQLERDLGDEAPAAVFHGQALSALRTGALVEAELAVEKLVARGGLDFAPERDFVLGVTAFVRCERAEAQASGPEAEPFAFDVAIAHAEAAQAAWQRAAIARGDWPEARRNLVRAMNKLDELRKKRQAAIERKRKDQRQKFFHVWILPYKFFLFRAFIEKRGDTGTRKNTPHAIYFQSPARNLDKIISLSSK